ncbi:MAG: hypothetical protein ACPLQP_06330, partial [Moorellaceae bacterium]
MAAKLELCPKVEKCGKVDLKALTLKKITRAILKMFREVTEMGRLLDVAFMPHPPLMVPEVGRGELA